MSKYFLKVRKVTNLSEYRDTIPVANNEYQPPSLQSFNVTTHVLDYALF